MNFRFPRLTLLVGILVLSMSAPSQAALIVSLDAPDVTGSTANIDVRFEFNGDPSDSIEAFQISVIGSDSVLTVGGTDYRRFSFALNSDPLADASNLLATWSGTPSIADGGFEFFTPADVVGGPFLTPNPSAYLIGTLSINLAGLSPGSYLVTLAGNDPLFPTLALGTVGGDFSDIPVSNEPVDGVAFDVAAAAVPEPSTAALLILGVAVGAGVRGRLSRKQRDSVAS